MARYRQARCLWFIALVPTHELSGAQSERKPRSTTPDAVLPPYSSGLTCPVARSTASTSDICLRRFGTGYRFVLVWNKQHLNSSCFECPRRPCTARLSLEKHNAWFMVCPSNQQSLQRRIIPTSYWVASSGTHITPNGGRLLICHEIGIWGYRAWGAATLTGMKDGDEDVENSDLEASPKTESRNAL